jgi:hypothetical protein
MSGLRDQIAAATDPAVRAALEERLLYIGGSRVLLSLTFAGICAMVYLAHKKRKGKTT